MLFAWTAHDTAIRSMSDAGLITLRGRRLEPRLFLGGLVTDYPAQKRDLAEVMLRG